MAKRNKEGKRPQHTYAASERSKQKLEMRPGESDLEYYRRLAKMADQRLVRLEALKNEPGFENVTSYAYAAAMRDIDSYGGAGKKMRFNTAPPKNPTLFREKVSDMIRFISAPTSTKAGIIQTYKKRAEEVNRMYGTNFTWQELADFFESGDADNLFREYGSKTVMTAIGRIQRTTEDVKKRIEENKNRKADIVDQVALDIMKSDYYDTSTFARAMTKEELAEARKRLGEG